MVDGSGTTNFTYNANGDVSSVSYNYTGLATVQTLTYAYCADGSRDSMTWTNGTSTVAVWTYQYDGAGRLIGVTANYGSATEPTIWTYDGEDKLLGQLNANGTSTQFTYNELRGWPTSITQYAGTTPFAAYGLTYDGGANTVGNLTSIGEVINGQSATISYSYDALYRLTGESRTGSASHSYGYDLAGNLTSRDSTTYTVDAANKLLSDGLGSATYDGDGNTLTMSFGAVPAGSTFQWDTLSRLTNYNFAGGPTGGVTNKYDAFGRRVFRDAIPGVSPATIFVYDGDLLLGEVGTDGTPLAAYTWGAAGLISRRDLVTNTTYWYHFGPQGETRQVTNSTGTVVGTYVYDAYGALTGSSGTGAGPFQYGGQFGYYTDLGGFVLCGARWYEPRLGRWLSRDPIDYEGGENLYAYCDGDPVNIVDPSGLDGSSFCKWLDRGLDIASFIPGVGEIADGIHAVSHVVRGNYGEAALYAASVIPGLHEGIKAVKGYKLLRAATMVENLATKSLKAERLAANQAAGKAAEILVKQKIEATGREVVGSQISVRLANGQRRIIDHVVVSESGKLILVEVKAGGAVRGASQIAADKEILENGGKFVGRKAKSIISRFGKEVKAHTKVIRQ